MLPQAYALWAVQSVSVSDNVGAASVDLARLLSLLSLLSNANRLGRPGETRCANNAADRR
jgi:hypothetical protein